MQKQILIELINKLKESHWIPSEKKMELLLNFSEKQVRLFLDLKEAAFIDQSNLNYVIGEISKIDLKVTVNKESLNHLWYPNLKEANSEILKIILGELKNNQDRGNHNIDELSKLVSTYNSSIPILKVTSVLNNSTIRELDLTKVVLSTYYQILEYSSCYGVLSDIIDDMNQIILDKTILNSFKTIEDRKERVIEYESMLVQFLILIPFSLAGDMSNFQKYHQFVSSFIRNSKVAPDDITTILQVCISHFRLTADKLPYLESVLLTCKDCSNIRDIVRILNEFEQIEKNNGNLGYLTMQVYEKVSAEIVNEIYGELIRSIACTDNKLFSFKDINDFLVPLLENKDFIQYILENGNNFIIFALQTNPEFLPNFTKLATKCYGNCRNMDAKVYEEVLNSFVEQPKNLPLVAQKLEILSQVQVLNTISDNPEILIKINLMINNYIDIADFITNPYISESELELLKDPVFLTSDFFRNGYLNLVYKNVKLRITSAAYQNNFFSILSTFDLDDPNLIFYMTSLFGSVSDEQELANIFESRILSKNNNDLSNMKASLYKVLKAQDENSIDEYIEMLAYVPNDFDIKADTPVIYQKQIGKKKN